MCEKGQGLGKERERSLQDVRDVVGFAEKTQSAAVLGKRTDPRRAEGEEGGAAGKILAERSHLRGSGRHPVSIKEQC